MHQSAFVNKISKLKCTKEHFLLNAQNHLFNLYKFYIGGIIIVFYEILLKLCEINNIKPTYLVEKLGFSRGNLSKWRNGAIPNGETLAKIATHFSVTTDYLLGVEQKETPVDTDADRRKIKAQQLFNDLPTELQEEALRHLRFLVQEKEKKDT